MAAVGCRRMDVVAWFDGGDDLRGRLGESVIALLAI
jgi:hypothetical protein